MLTPRRSFAAYEKYIQNAWRTPVADQTSQEKRRKLDQTPDADVEAARKYTGKNQQRLA